MTVWEEELLERVYSGEEEVAAILAVANRHHKYSISGKDIAESIQIVWKAWFG